VTSLTEATTEATIEQDHLAAPPPSERTRPIGVLILDDEESVRRVLALGLRRHGFVVWLAANSVEALELYVRHSDAIDVVLSDVCMPVRDGPETLAALRELDPHICFYFMSGDMGKYTEENLLALGAIAVFCKPLRLRELAREFMRMAAPNRMSRRG
jgi:two-component system OmpR family response regulator